MGIVWEAYHKGVPLLGVPENPIDSGRTSIYIYIPGTQTTLVLIGKDLILEGITTKIEGPKQVPGKYIYNS